MKNDLPSVSDGQTIVNFSASFLSRFGIEPPHRSIPLIDSLLSRKEKAVVLILDGLSAYNRRLFPSEAADLIASEVVCIDSVYPPTTVAATTAFLSGLYPKENGWLGWTTALNERTILSFSGREAGSEEAVGPGLSVLRPYVSIIEKMNEAGVKAKAYFPAQVAGPSFPKDIVGSFPLLREDLDGGLRFAYVYEPEPDMSLHEAGTSSPLVGQKIKYLNDAVKDFASSLKEDEALFVIADHGLIDVREIDIASHDDLVSLLKRGQSIEGRVASYFVKDGKEGVFSELWKQYYPQIPLYSHEEVVSSDFFGIGKPHPDFASSIGDFVAIPGSNELLVDSFHFPDACHYRAHHAGISREERKIGVSFFHG